MSDDITQPVSEIELAQVLLLTQKEDLRLHIIARRLAFERDKLRDAIKYHHSQRAGDRCIEDDDKLYAAADLPYVDRRVGDKAAMLEDCKRYIERRCEGGGPWPTYRELEDRLRWREVDKEFPPAQFGPFSAEVLVELRNGSRTVDTYYYCSLAEGPYWLANKYSVKKWCPIFPVARGTGAVETFFLPFTYDGTNPVTLEINPPMSKHYLVSVVSADRTPIYGGMQMHADKLILDMTDASGRRAPAGHYMAYLAF